MANFNHPLSKEDELAVATILMEADGESHEGKTAVGRVILSRMKNKYSSDGTVEGTVLRTLKNKTNSYQFSAWNTGSNNDGNPLRKQGKSPEEVLATLRQSPAWENNVAAWEEAKKKADKPFPTLYYKVGSKEPWWAKAKSVTEVGTIGRHRFFTDK